MLKKAITVSGGFDSGCLPFIFFDNLSEYDLVFFRYQQIYLVNEFNKADKFAKHLKLPLIIIECPNILHNHERRNFLFLSELKVWGYQEVVMGSRNLLPMFDKYKDSNYWSLKRIAGLLNIKLHLPITGWSKKKVLGFLSDCNYLDFYNCYTNGDDIKTCQCPNCQELRRLLP